MSIEVTRADESEMEKWNDYVDRSPHASPFHRREGIELLANHADVDLHPLIGKKGQEVVGVFPIFEDRRGPLTTVISPPPNTEVYYLGLALTDPGQLKQRKRERRNRRFVEGCLDWIESELEPDFCHLRTVDRYTDLRPFKERRYEVTPYYTYVVDLTDDPEDVLMRFSSDARSNVRSTDEGDYEIEIGGLEEARGIIDRVRERHVEQGEPYHITSSFIETLYTTFPDGQVRPYVCRTDDGIAGGIVALEYGDTIYRWQGGTKVDVDIPVNDLLDWHIMRDAMDRGIERYDLVGANTPRICRYKSKFGPDLVPYHGAIKRSSRGKVVSTVRRHLPVNV